MHKAIKFSAVLFVLCSMLTAASLAADIAQGSDDRWRLADVSGHLPDLRYNLVADNGKPETQENMRGKVTLLFFGYTSCPDECPATMLRLTNVLKALGQNADAVRVLFVTVDPGIDTPRILHNYMKNFDARHMEGLTGNGDAIEAVAKRYRAAYQPHNDGDADVVHSDAVYIFDAKGHARLLASPSDTDENLTHDLLRLTAEAS